MAFAILRCAVWQTERVGPLDRAAPTSTAPDGIQVTEQLLATAVASWRAAGSASEHVPGSMTRCCFSARGGVARSSWPFGSLLAPYQLGHATPGRVPPAGLAVAVFKHEMDTAGMGVL